MQENGQLFFNRTGRKFGLYIDSQIPRNSMVFLFRSRFSISVSQLMKI